MSMFICASCGTQHGDSEQPPGSCAICRADGNLEPGERPAWTTLDQLRGGHANLIQRLEPDLFSIRTFPTFPPGQRALLLRTERGNLLWGCVTLIDAATIRTIDLLGGVNAIAVSDPRHFATIVEWSQAFGRVPVYVHGSSRRWLMRPDAVVHHWEGCELRLPHDVTLVHVGTHAGAGTLLHWPAAASGRGALLTGDLVQVPKDGRRTGFLASSRDLVPRSADGVRKLVSSIERFEFEALYDAWADGGITRDARAIVLESARRDLMVLSGTGDVGDPRCSLIA